MKEFIFLREDYNQNLYAENCFGWANWWGESESTSVMDYCIN